MLNRGQSDLVQETAAGGSRRISADRAADDGCREGRIDFSRNGLARDAASPLCLVGENRGIDDVEFANLAVDRTPSDPRKIVVDRRCGRVRISLLRMAPPSPETSPPISVSPVIATVGQALGSPSSTLSTRLPSPLFVVGVGSLPEASIVRSLAPGPTISRERPTVSSPCVNRITAGPPLVSDGANVI